MLNDPDIRNVSLRTTGDFLAFELFDAGEWRAVRVSLTALAVLGAVERLSATVAFERHIERIKAVAFGVRDVGNGFVLLDVENFE
jgi:hypothetical protein